MKIMGKQMGGGKMWMWRKDWVKICIPRSREDSSPVFVGVWHGLPIQILVLEMRSDTNLKFLLDEYPGEKLVNTTVLIQMFITVLDQ